MKKHRTFKGLLIPMIAVAMSAIFSSCDDKEMLESVHSRYAEFTVTNDMWYIDNNDEFRCDFKWNAIDEYLLQYGTVEAYKYESYNQGERQVPLPYIYPVAFNDGTGNTIYQPLNIRFDIEEGYISFIVADVGDISLYQTIRSSLETMRFRAVATVPTQYIINQ